ncbi:methylated-DNA--[protein]-cysteine S-methyltransferase [Cellulomonas chengniuliangii]|uniref:Methylated-DNA--[protein]-cysteine S-methyltransferase n=1 Tax=Cellulomonas chengniuliangii TaxID=2968084 RepID=A0ABY5KUW4_9CELL|nr:methylated-DNA--[protein]-cysteine S-methyltransferase [Cellulomonas chengniuliangii]MCC2308650.1 methylated-DNA--[protein]-cysteine S-methyltransferase [Cellulomonas chengniuliangii]MCC2317667.1 methylated-DNA--[protein]-cysteine S-methyltransferase [Cellulomonas chengniuliangii]UUI74009.1 methylated-DNA--[protein]-cysteine S-methyltransferase [Cellulomonas chengniuliangii]
MTSTTVATLDTPDGPFTVVLDADSVLAAGWTAEPGTLVALMHPTLRPGAWDVVAGRRATDPMTRSVLDAVAAYYDGDLDAPARIAVRQHSGEFRMRAWDALRQVPAGERLTYADHATRSGRPAAVRAAAAACAMNAAALFVPCHRVLRSDGGLGGFRYGLPLKQRLLDRETATGAQSVLFTG